jgi:hypothetical protein
MKDIFSVEKLTLYVWSKSLLFKNDFIMWYLMKQELNAYMFNEFKLSSLFSKDSEIIIMESDFDSMIKWYFIFVDRWFDENQDLSI